ncbi:MAG: hypothetical protein PVF58_07130 [Candidatus Methanofastidiosia archaeon]|jgi:hypothetical protein
MEKENGNHAKRPPGITSESIFLCLIGVFVILTGFFGNGKVFSLLISVIVGLFFLMLSYGLWNGKSWAYISFAAVVIIILYFLASDIVKVVFAHKDIGMLTMVKWAFFALIIISEVKDMRNPQIKEYLHVKT